MVSLFLFVSVAVWITPSVSGFPAGSSESCTSNDNCEMNAVCDSGNKCRFPAGSSESCTSNDNCEMNAVCDSGNKCRFPAGSSESCTSNDNCEMNAVCDSGNKCRFPAGSSESCTSNDNCEMNAVCDSGNKCNSTITGAIVGGLLAFLAVVVIIAVVVIVYCRRRHHPQSSCGNQLAAFQVENILHEQKSVSLILYPARIELLHRNSNLYFRQEYQELLQKEKEFTYTSYVGKLDINRVKNQCADILPYDYTRVKLYCQDDLGQDYINASYIMGLQSPCDYLATQGPLVSTIPDFWRMVLDHRSPVIVMLSDLTEHGQSKVDQYWPRAVNVPVHYGKVTVTMTSLATLPKYTLRNFSVSMNTQDALKVSHFQLVGWESQGSTFSLDDVADTLYDVGEMTVSSDGPVTVHCSNGTARTCSFIALDTLRTHVVQHALGEDVDVFNVLLNIIKCRPHMIQSERQYMFIHDVLRVMVERKMRNESGRREMYENIGGRNSSVYESTYAYVPEHNVYEVIGKKTATSTTEV